MNIFIVGATGRVGQKLIAELEKRGHRIYAGTRHPEQLKETKQVTPVYLDLHASVKELAAIIGKPDVVYFVAGSRGQDLLQTDLNGAVKVMQAAEQQGTKRYIHLSSLFALEPERWNEPFLEGITDYTIAKFFSDRWLIDKTALEYTILQPGSLKEEAGTGKIEVNVATPSGISIEDVAAVLAELLEQPNTVKKVVKLHGGETPIEAALNQL